MSRYHCALSLLGAALCCLPTASALAQASTPTPSTPTDLKITFTNEGTSSFTLTPLWFGFQNGGFDLFDPASTPSAGLELIAEDGNPGTLISEFTAAAQPGNLQGVVFAPGGFGGAPVVEPGETGVAYITPMNLAAYQYISFASMVIPTNDTFLGNADPTAYQVFTPAGDINDPSGEFSIEIYGADLWDAGTELNDGMGAPFSSIGGMATDTSDGIGAADDLMEFAGSTTPSGLTINDFIAPGELVATITISQIPEPSTLLLTLLAITPLGASRMR